jgi:hypothetical protein
LHAEPSLAEEIRSWVAQRLSVANDVPSVEVSAAQAYGRNHRCERMVEIIDANDC